MQIYQSSFYNQPPYALVKILPPADTVSLNSSLRPYHLQTVVDLSSIIINIYQTESLSLSLSLSEDVVSLWCHGGNKVGKSK